VFILCYFVFWYFVCLGILGLRVTLRFARFGSRGVTAAASRRLRWLVWSTANTSLPCKQQSKVALHGIVRCLQTDLAQISIRLLFLLLVTVQLIAWKDRPQNDLLYVERDDKQLLTHSLSG